MNCLTASCHIPLYSHQGVDNWKHVVDGAYGFSGEDLIELHHNDTLFVGIDPQAEVSRGLTYTQMVYFRYTFTFIYFLSVFCLFE